MLRPSFLPGLWERIESMIVDGSIRSVDEVEPELSQRDDEIHRWAKAQSELFVPIDQDVERETRTSLAAHPRLIWNRLRSQRRRSVRDCASECPWRGRRYRGAAQEYCTTQDSRRLRCRRRSLHRTGRFRRGAGLDLPIGVRRVS
jgi:Domain of unknown function (DUF4411)